MREGQASTASALGLALVGTTCCALPALLVVLGAGGAVASLLSSAPWLVTLSKYKAWTFASTGAALAYAAWRMHRVEACDVADAVRLRRQRRVLVAAGVLLAVSIFVAYALLPIVRWWEGMG